MLVSVAPTLPVLLVLLPSSRGLTGKPLLLLLLPLLPLPMLLLPRVLLLSSRLCPLLSRARPATPTAPFSCPWPLPLRVGRATAPLSSSAWSWRRPARAAPDATGSTMLFLPSSWIHIESVPMARPLIAAPFCSPLPASSPMPPPLLLPPSLIPPLLLEVDWLRVGLPLGCCKAEEGSMVIMKVRSPSMVRCCHGVGELAGGQGRRVCVVGVGTTDQQLLRLLGARGQLCM